MTPWQKIMHAAKRGIGLRLTVEEVSRLSMDDAIETRAALDDEQAPNTVEYLTDLINGFRACPDCKGDVLGTPRLDCPRCKGTGRIEIL